MMVQNSKNYRKLWAKVKRSPFTHIFMYIMVIGGVLLFFTRGTGQLGYDWQWYRMPRYIYTVIDGEFIAGPLIKGLLVTLNITWISLVLMFVFGLATALFRLSDSIVARTVARGYLELIRNTPMLIQLFFIYFVLGPIFDIDRMTSAILALSLFEGAYASEIFRAGIISIHKGQHEAAYSLGLGTFHTYWHIILPQAMRQILPPLTGQAISLIKDSALVSTIAIYDLTQQANAIVAETFLTFEAYFTIAAIYLVLTITMSIIVNMMEKRFKFVH